MNPQPVFLGDTRFVVALPEQHHAALEQVIATMKTRTTPMPTGSFEVTYWIVTATPADETAIAPELDDIAKTLGALGALGKRKFALIDRVSGRVVDGQEASMRSVRTEISEVLSSDGGGLQLELELKETGTDDQRGPYVRTTLRLEPGRPVVLGDSALSRPVATEDGLLLYVVRARQVD